jgi:hypothetical protein
LVKISYKAATTAATSPATPPNPANIAFAPPVELTGAGVVVVLERIVEFDLVVVAGALVVVIMVEVVVEAAVVLVLEAVLALELVLDVVEAEVVVVAEALAKDAEYAEQRA